MTTTSEAIVKVLRDTLAAATPTLFSDDRFVPYAEWPSEYLEYIALTPKHRLFSIRDTGPETVEDGSNLDVEWVKTEVEVLVAYPRDNRYQTADYPGHLGRDRVKRSDATLIRDRIGTGGYQTLALAVGDDAVVTNRDPGSTGYERAGNVDILRVTLDVQYWRACP